MMEDEQIQNTNIDSKLGDILEGNCPDLSHKTPSLQGRGEGIGSKGK
jgi:hypothetical protein